jgi:hypothetical protein
VAANRDVAVAADQITLGEFELGRRAGTIQLSLFARFEFGCDSDQRVTWAPWRSTGWMVDLSIHLGIYISSRVGFSRIDSMVGRRRRFGGGNSRTTVFHAAAGLR